jgi:hypothetical protein
MKQLIILVYYINIDGLSRHETEEYICRCKYIFQFSDDLLDEINVNIQQIFLPVKNKDTKVECIYPKIADENDKILDILNQISEKMKNVI